MSKITLAPSILAADFTRLGEQVETAVAAGIDHIHIDVMDGRFVPNISIGAPIVRALQPLAAAHNFILDVHLMIIEPEMYLAAFAEAGANYLTVHVETCPHLHRTVQQIHELGVKAGVAINPATPLGQLEEILPDIDLALVMSVNPGFGGQSYIPGSTDKIRRLRQMFNAHQVAPLLQVDGGIKPHNAAEVVAAGTDVLVAGSAIFGGDRSITANIQAFYDTIID